MRDDPKIVCPLGRFGNCYVLRRRLHSLYQWFTRVCWGVLLFFILMMFLGPNGRFGAITWPHDLPLMMVGTVCLVVMVGQMTIASRGQIADPADAETFSAAVKTRAAPRLQRLFVFIGSLALLALMGAAITYQMKSARPIPAIEALGLGLGFAGLSYVYRTRGRGTMR